MATFQIVNNLSLNKIIENNLRNSLLQLNILQTRNLRRRNQQIRQHPQILLNSLNRTTNITQLYHSKIMGHFLII